MSPKSPGKGLVLLKPQGLVGPTGKVGGGWLGSALLRLAPAVLTSFGLQVSLPHCEQIIYLALSCKDSVLAFWSKEVTLVG